MKVYLSLIFALLIVTAYQAYSNGCSYVKIDYSIFPTENCDIPNGLVFASLSKEHSAYNFVWTNLATNNEVTTTSGNIAYSLKAGDYRLTISPKDDPNCRISKPFFIHGKHHPIYKERDFEGCYEGDYSEIKIEGVKLTIWDDGFWKKEHLPLKIQDENGNFVSDKDYYHLTWAVRTNNPGQAPSRWTVVPKPKAVSYSYNYPNISFARGNTYEFVAVSREARRIEPFIISKPVRATIINESGSFNKLTNNTNILNDGVFISPQPANNYLTIDLNLDFKMTSYEIINLNGQLLVSNSTPNVTESVKVNVADLNSGIYILKISSETESISEKIIIR